MIARVAGAAAIAAAALLAPAAGASAATCAPANVPGGEWSFYSGTLDGHRNQIAESSITTQNVGGLDVAWHRTTPDGGTIHSTPTVAGGCVFFGTDLGNVYSVNADTGDVVWSRTLGASVGSNYFEGAGIVGAPAVANGLVYVGATTPNASVLSALDQATGEIVWSTVVDDDDGGGLDSSPVPFNGMVFQAFKGDESSNHSNPGYVFVDGSRTGGGAILVKRHVIPAEDFAAGDRGGSIVNTPVVDLERKLLFAGTGNPASRRQNPRTNSLLKIDADPASPTFGDILDSHRGTSDSYPAPMDVDSPVCQSDVQWPIGRYSCAQFDFNFLASPNMFTHSDGRVLLGELQKSGVYTVVDTQTMERVWQTPLSPPCFSCNLSSSAVDENGIYVATSGGNLYSLDRDTGLVQWVVPLTGTFRFNGVAVANDIVYSLNDAGVGLQAFDARTGVPLFAHPFSQDTEGPMHDMGNSSGVSVARNTVYATSQWNSTSTLFALRLGAGGGGGLPGLPELPALPELPSVGTSIISGPAAQNYGYMTPVMVTEPGGELTYTNLDILRHNVVSRDVGADTKPLFRTPLIGTGETVAVEGTENLVSGRTYEFFCQPHPGMQGTLVVR